MVQKYFDAMGGAAKTIGDSAEIMHQAGRELAKYCAELTDQLYDAGFRGRAQLADAGPFRTYLDGGRLVETFPNPRGL